MLGLRSLFIVFTVLVLSACAATPNKYDFILYDRIDNLDTLPLSQNIPLPGEYISGQYDNGLRYYIRQNFQPLGRVEIRLILNAGSLLEEDNQRGFAHFVEHMAFNGTEEFSQEDIVAFVESSGMKVGSHLNAFTNFDNTFYVLELPSDDPKIVETGIRLIENWAHKVSFDPIEIHKERGVVLEEWRSSKNVNERLTMKHLEKTITGSRWLERFPIGQPEIIQNGADEDLIAYYKKWYRPDLMSVVVIGDISVLDVAGLLDTYLGTIPAQADPVDANDLYASYNVNENIEPIVSIQTDSELTTTQFALMTVQPRKPVVTFEDLRHQYLVGLHTTMLNVRLHEKVVSEDFPTLNASVDYAEYFRHKEVYSFVAGAKTGKTTEAIRAILTEAYRAKQNGFTATELERAKQSWLADLNQQAQTILSEVSSNHANKLLSHILNAYPLLDADDALVFAQRVLPTISLDEVNKVGQGWLTKENRLVQISSPENEKDTLPSAAQIIAIWEEIANSSLAAFVDKAVPDTLMTIIPEPGSVVNKEYNSDEDYHVWTLSNGARVVLKETQLVTGQITFRSFSEGGSSVLDDTLYNRTRMTAQILDSMGVANYDYITMMKFLSDKNVAINASIDNYYERMSGDFTAQDVSTFMQLLHLKFTQTRLDEANFNNYISYVRPQVLNQFNSPQAKFSEAVRSALYQHSERDLPFDTAMLNSQSLPAMHSFYQQRFGNAGDFTFIFVGDFKVDKLEPFLNTYIATLPASEERESYSILPDERLAGEIMINIKENTEPRAEVYIEYRGDVVFSHADEVAFGALQNALDIKLRQKIREEKSAAYFVNVGGYIAEAPRAEFALHISFSSEPSRVDEIIADVNLILTQIQEERLEQRFVDNFITQQKEQYAFDIKTNDYWAYYLTRLQTKEKPIANAQYHDYLDALTVEDIRTLAKKYLATEHRIQAVMTPKE
jgi:zinc protease